MSIGLKLSISQMKKQGKVKKGHVYTNPSTKNKPARHNLQNNIHKKLDKKCDLVQKTTQFLDHYLITYEFLKVEKK